MKAAIYARVSPERQGREQTVDSQLDALRRWATAHGHELSENHVYIDEGYSGARLDRPALDRLRDAAREGEFDVLGVYSPDRLARRYAYQVLLLEELRRAACDVEFVERPISDDPHDQLLLQIQGAIAEYERAVLAERFRRGKLQKARAGQWGAGPGPYGYRYVPRRDGVPGHLEVDEDEAAVVRMLYRWLVDERMTVRQIIKRLAAGPWRPRNGKRLWSNAVVHRVLSDPLYAGTAYANRYAHVPPRKPRSAGPRAGQPTCREPRPREEWIAIPVPAIVDASTYQDASEQLARNSALSFRNNTRNDYLLRCLHTCRTCGYAMHGVTSSGSGGRRRYSYYMCHGKDTLARDRACPCPQPRTRVEELDAAVWGHVKRLLDEPATLAAQFEERARQAAALDVDADAAGRKWEAQLRRLNREERRLLDAYQAEAIELDELKDRREQIQIRKQVLVMQRDQEQRLRCERQTAKEVWADLTAFCERVRSRLDEAPLAERQRILQLLIERVIVGEDSLEIRHVIPLGRLKAEPADPGPTDPTGSGGGEGDEPEGATPNEFGARLRSDGVDVGSLMGSLVGQTEERTRQALRIVDAMAPCVLFVDEIEKALAGVQSSGQTDSGVSARMFGTMLGWLNDHESDVFVVATSNDVSKLPPEFSRAERWDGTFFIDLPGQRERDLIWRMYMEKFGLDPAQPRPSCEGWTGAEIRSCCRLAALLDVPLVEAALNVVPVAVTAGESVEKLRNWASGRCLSADRPGLYTRHPGGSGSSGRSISRDPSVN